MSDELKALLCSILIVLAVAAVAFLSVVCERAHAREGGDWSSVDPDTRAWIKSLHRPDIGDGKSASCCGEGDAYEADLGEVGDDGKNYAIVTGTRGNPLPVGTRLEIRKGSIQNTEGNPTEHVIVFANEAGYVFCFVPNGAG